MATARYEVGSAGKKVRRFSSIAAARKLADAYRARKLKGVYIRDTRTNKFTK